MYLGLDCGTSGLKALLVGRERRGGRAPRPASIRRTVRGPAGPSRIPRSGAPRWPGRSRSFANGRARGGRRAEGDRLFRSDARRGRARPVRPSGSPGDSAQRRPGAAEAAELARDHPHLAGDRRREADARLHRPEAPVACRGTSPKLRDRIDCRARAEGLSAPALCGERGTDMSDAAGPVDARRGGARSGRPRRSPPAAPSASWAPHGSSKGRPQSGQCVPAAAEATWVCRTASWSPRAAATRRSARSGSAQIAPGEAFISLGTATQLIVATDRYLSAPEKLVHSFAHALPGRWYAMAAMLNGAGALAFAARLARLHARCARARGGGRLSRARRRSSVLPYLSGERTPLDDPFARGVLFGMSETTSRADVARAVMEGRGADARRGARLPSQRPAPRSSRSASSAAARRARYGRG